MSQSREDLQRKINALEQRIKNLMQMNDILRRLILSLSRSNATSTKIEKRKSDKRMLH